jgi:hypothetical protein
MTSAYVCVVYCLRMSTRLRVERSYRDVCVCPPSAARVRNLRIPISSRCWHTPFPPLSVHTAQQCPPNTINTTGRTNFTCGECSPSRASGLELPRERASERAMQKPWKPGTKPICIFATTFPSPQLCGYLGTAFLNARGRCSSSCPFTARLPLVPAVVAGPHLGKNLLRPPPRCCCSRVASCAPPLRFLLLTILLYLRVR